MLGPAHGLRGSGVACWSADLRLLRFSGLGSTSRPPGPDESATFVGRCGYVLRVVVPSEPPRRRRRPLRWVGGALLVVVLVALFTAWQALSIRSSLLGARADLEAMAEHLDAGDQKAATEAARRADDATASADGHSHTPVWWMSQLLPVVGDDVEAVRTVSAGLHDLTDGVVLPMVEAGLTPDQLRPEDGRIPIEPLRRAGEVLDEAAPRIADVDESTGRLDTSGLLEPVKGPVEELQVLLADAARVARAAGVAADLLPGMLGEDSERTYLVAFQNNAEVRATGGMPGSMVELTARDGQLELGRSFTPGDLEAGKRVVTPTAYELELFQPRYVVAARPTFNPDFPRNGELFAAFWEASGRRPIDGVISVDPVALSYLLDYTGPIAVGNEAELRSDNAVEVLLRDSYEQLDNEEQDKFFARAARDIFNTVIQANGSATELVTALGRGIDERRVAVWSADPAEQSLLAGEDVANELPQESSRPEIGFYVNGDKGDKLGYYLHSDVAVTPSSCNDGTQAIIVDVTLRSDVPASGLPDYVYGVRLPGLPRNAMRNRYLLYAPSGGEVREATIDGEDLAVTRVLHDTRPVAFATIDLGPGETRRLRYVVGSGPAQDGDIRVLSTPLADGTGGEAFVESGC